MALATDPLTAELFIKSRNNQRFSCAENRIAFHNKKANAERKKMRVCNRPLFVNYKILSEIMNGISRKSFHKEFLLGKGFSFAVFTGYSEFEGKSHPTIYNYILIPKENDFLLVINKNEVND